MRGFVHALPESPQVLVFADCHVAFPDASVVRTYPLTAPDEIRIFWNEPVQATSSLAVGLDVPMPTLPDAVIVTFAVSFGPIIVDPRILLVILLPNADAPEAETIF